MTNAGYSISGNGILSLSGSPNNSQANMDSKTITASNSGTFTANPTIYYSDQTPSGNNYIHVTSHTSANPFVITQPSANGNNSFTITGTTKILSSDTSGSANVYLSPTTTTNPSIDSIQFNGGQTTHYSVNGVVSPISVAIAGEGNISLSLSSSGSNSAALSSSSGNGDFSVNINLSGSNAQGSLTLTATDENGSTLSETITLTQYTTGLNSTPSLHALYISSAQTSHTNACNASVGSTKVYGNYSSSVIDNLGSYLHTTDESPILNGTGASNTNFTQTAVFAGGNSFYKSHAAYWNGSAYVTIGSSTRSIQVDNDGKIIAIQSC
jgi:hypothetical protein